jgi:hypothetical protein
MVQAMKSISLAGPIVLATFLLVGCASSRKLTIDDRTRIYKTDDYNTIFDATVAALTALNYPPRETYRDSGVISSVTQQRGLGILAHVSVSASIQRRGDAVAVVITPMGGASPHGQTILDSGTVAHNMVRYIFSHLDIYVIRCTGREAVVW